MRTLALPFTLALVASSVTAQCFEPNFGTPLGVAVEASGAILVADPHSGIIRIDPATGVQTIAAKGGSLSFPSGVAVVR